jgi:HAD superfamily hydrolase (TIGR01509 family)
MGIKGVIFDLDGTIIDSLETYTQAFNRGLEQLHEEPIPKNELAALLNTGLGLKDTIMKRYSSLDQETAEKYFEEIRDAYLELEKEGVRLQPGAREVLSRLKARGVKIGIVTGRTTSGEGRWHELRRLNAAQFIDVMITGADSARNKPAPDGLIKCIRELGLSAQECVFVGDSQADLLTGKAAGVKTIGITTGVAEKGALTLEKPNAIIDSMAELTSWIESWEQDETDS